MRVFRDLFQLHLEQESVLTIGAFDGLHLGHQELVRRLIRSARESSRLSGVVTFDPLPRTVLAPDSSFICLTTIDDKIELLEDWGVDVLIIIPFTMAVANTTARDFVSRLSEQARMTELWVGWNFALGRGREGNVDNLGRLGQELGFRLHVVQPVSDGSVPVSSTQIRNLLGGGRVREAAVEYSQAECLNDAALEAARGYIFTPAYMNNGPVAVWVSIPFRFKLADRK